MHYGDDTIHFDDATAQAKATAEWFRQRVTFVVITEGDGWSVTLTGF